MLILKLSAKLIHKYFNGLNTNYCNLSNIVVWVRRGQKKNSNVHDIVSLLELNLFPCLTPKF